MELLECSRLDNGFDEVVDPVRCNRLVVTREIREEAREDDRGFVLSVFDVARERSDARQRAGLRSDRQRCILESVADRPLDAGQRQRTTVAIAPELVEAPLEYGGDTRGRQEVVPREAGTVAEPDGVGTE
ncbi:hypothetical protein BBD46_10500 [Natrialba sp. SSL1]|nr:hypothetical protein BBD46_10500 [Natrialba sp. SSL1]